jgi:peptidyl-tRNA hydrolase
MTPGLMAAQVAHIGDAFMRTKIRDDVEFSNEELAWMKDPYISVLSVDNPEELEIVMNEARDDGLSVHKWIDLLPSKNLNRPMSNVLVGISIGPTDFDRVKAITGTLPLA